MDLEHGRGSGRLARDRRESRATSESVRAAKFCCWRVDREAAESDPARRVVALGPVVVAVAVRLVGGSADELFGS